MRFPLALVCALIASSIPLHAQTTDSRIAASDLLQIKAITAPAISPDGTQIAYTVRGLTPLTADPREPHSPTSQLWLVAIDGSSGPHALTPDDVLASAPAWSPKGDRIAYLRAEPDTDRARIWIHPADGKGTDFAVTPALADLSPPRWSPDGTHLLFSARVSKVEVDAALVLATKATSKKNPHPRPVVKLLVPPDPITTDPNGNKIQRHAWLAANVPLVLVQPEPPAPAPAKTYTHLFTVEAKPKKTPNDLTPQHADYTQPVWSADGHDIYCTGPGSDSAETPGHYGRLYALTANGSALKTLPAPDHCDLVSDPTPSPAGRSIAFVTADTHTSPSIDRVAILQIPDGKITLLTAKFYSPLISDLRWSPDGKFVYFSSLGSGGITLYRVPATGGNPSRLIAPGSGIGAYAISRDHLALVVAKATNPAELYASDPDGKNQSILTTHNSAWLRYKNTANFEYHLIKRPDKTTVDYWLLRPPYFEGGTRYPLLLICHPGTFAMQGPGFSRNWQRLQFFAARGYAVLVCNLPSHKSNDHHAQSYIDDLLTAAADCTDKNTWIDPDREVVLSEGGQGGPLALLLSSHEDRFKAVVIENGIYAPADEKVVHTPLLILQSETASLDETTQAQSFYESLKALDRPAEYALYPRVASGGDHSYEATQQIDRLVRADDFFRRTIGNPAQPAPPPPKPPAAPAPTPATVTGNPKPPAAKS